MEQTLTDTQKVTARRVVARGALEAMGGPTDDDRVGVVAQHLDVEHFGCSECGAPRDRVIVVNADGSPRTKIDPVTGLRPMSIRELVYDLCVTQPRAMGWLPPHGAVAE